MKVRFAYPFVFLTVAVALLVATAFAQGYRASISGRLTDPSGSGVPNATVRAANVATNVESAPPPAMTAGTSSHSFCRAPTR